jgi:hypothetical protein
VQLAEWLPGKPLSLHNFRLLRTDSVGKHDGYVALGIVPQPFSPRRRSCRMNRRAKPSVGSLFAAALRT